MEVSRPGLLVLLLTTHLQHHFLSKILDDYKYAKRRYFCSVLEVSYISGSGRTPDLPSSGLGLVRFPDAFRYITRLSFSRPLGPTTWAA